MSKNLGWLCVKCNGSMNPNQPVCWYCTVTKKDDAFSQFRHAIKVINQLKELYIIEGYFVNEGSVLREFIDRLILEIQMLMGEWPPKK